MQNVLTDTGTREQWHNELFCTKGEYGVRTRYFLHRATIHKRSNDINTLEQVGGKQVSIIQKGFKALENFYTAFHEIAKLFVPCLGRTTHEGQGLFMEIDLNEA